MALPVTFTMADVREAGSADPWKTQDDFLAEVDPADIAEAATSYLHAIDGAGSAEDLAALASEEHEAGGEWERQSLADVGERLAETREGLGSQDLENTVEILGKVLTLAEDTTSDIGEEIGGPDGINSKILDHSRSAFDEFNAWHGSLVSIVEVMEEAAYDVGVVVVVPPPPGQHSPGLPDPVEAHENEHGFLSLPDDVKSKIRENYLGKAVDDTNATSEVVDDLIEAYRASLTTYGAELAGEGYDLAASPLHVWQTPEMAEFHAAEISAAVTVLAADPGDEEALARLNSATAMAGALAASVFDDDGNPAGTFPGEELPEYFDKLFGALSSEDLAGVGHLDLPGAEGAKRNLGNAIIASTSEVVGGVNPHENLEAIPKSIRDMMYDVEVGGGPAPLGYSGIAGYDPDSGEIFMSGLYEFQGLGALLDISTLTPSDQFAFDLGAAAISVQEQFNSWVDQTSAAHDANGNPTGESGVVVFDKDGRMHWLTGDDLASVERTDTGGSAALSVVARNLDASQDVMLDEVMREKIVGLGWGGHDEGAAEVLGVAAMRAQPTPENAVAAAEIAESVFSMIGESATTWRSLVPKDGQINNTLVGLGEQYIDAFSGSPESGGTALEGGQEAGKDGLFRASFVLPGRDRDGLGFLDFVGTMDESATVEDFLTDPDLARLQFAADRYFGESVENSIIAGRGGEFSQKSQEAASLYGNLFYQESVAAVEFAKEEYDAAELAAKRQKIWVDAAFGVLALHPVGHFAEGVVKEISNELLKGMAQESLKAVAGVGAEEVKEMIDKMASDAGSAAPDPATLQKEIENQVKSFYASGRRTVNYVLAEQLLLHESISVEEASDAEGVSVDLILKTDDDGNFTNELIAASDIRTDDQMRAINALIDVSSIGNMSIDSGTVWGHVSDHFAPFDSYTPEGRGDVDSDIFDRVRLGG